MSLRTAGLLTAAAALALSTTTPAQAAGGTYVALGDSYSAGTGTDAKVDDCYRSTFGYPALLADRAGLDLDYQACSGATTAGVRDNQLGALSTATNYVTMTIGGNDVGFADVLLECAQPGWMSNCDGAIGDGTAILRNQLPGRYDELFGQIKSKAPNATASVGGYPHLFNGEDCNVATFFSPDEQSDLNASTTELNSLINTKAGAHGFRYVDPVSAFKGHAVCDDPEWVNGASLPVEESYHPNRLGNEAYADLFATGVGATAKSSDSRSAAPSISKAQATRSQAKQVLAMDLTAPENLAKAESAGLNSGEIRRLNGQLKSSSTVTVEKALTRLQQLDRQTS